MLRRSGRRQRQRDRGDDEARAFRVSVAASLPQPSLAESLSNGEAGALAGLIGTSKTPATNASGHPC